MPSRPVPVSIHGRGAAELRGRLNEMRIATVTKAGVAPVAAADVDVGFSNPELFVSVEQGSIIGRMSLLRRVPFQRRLLRSTASPRGYWVGGTQRAKPLSRAALEGAYLNPLTIATLIALTGDALRFADPLTDTAVRSDVVRANTERMDSSFIDVNNAGIADVEPASVTSGGTIVNSTGDPARDVAVLIEEFGGDFASAYFSTDSLTATRIALARDAGGSFAFPDCGPRGGSILNIPLVTSRGSPYDLTAGGQLALIDASAIAVAIDGMQIDLATSATLEMADDPDNAPDQNTVQVSLFQADVVALKSVMHANWEVQRAGAVATVIGTLYPAG